MAESGATHASMLLVEEFFNAEDSRFVEALRRIGEGGALAPFVERWKKDPRPWTRAQILAYLAHPFDCPGHQVVVKRLFKHAEARKDDELMAAFLAAFDANVRRRKITRRRYDFESRTSWEEEILKTPQNTMKGGKSSAAARNPRTGAKMAAKRPPRRGALLFTYHTRYYLRRRAWRYFRRMARQRPKDYAPFIAKALSRYRDEDLAQGENIIDSWSLMHACFGMHDAVTFGVSHAALKEGRGLGELDARPYKPELWAAPECLPVLLDLLLKSPARLVRVWCMQLLRREHKDRFSSIPAGDLFALLEHEDGEVQQFAADLLQNAAGLEKLDLAAWLRLLQTKNLTALELLCQAMARHVMAERLDLPQCVELACARPAPVARMGLEFLKRKPIRTTEERALVCGVADTKCAAVSGELAEWALSLAGSAEHYDRDSVLRFFDSLHAPARARAWAWLTRLSGEKPDSPGYSDTVLWSRLLETPHDDLRLRFVDLLERRSKLPGTTLDTLAPVWCAVLLGVHRGGRQKGKAIRQLGEALGRDPAQGGRLLPILSVALRSVRGPERRAALAAVVGALEAQPALGDAVRKLVPNLVVEAAEAAP